MLIPLLGNVVYEQPYLKGLFALHITMVRFWYILHTIEHHFNGQSALIRFVSAFFGFIQSS